MSLIDVTARGIPCLANVKHYAFFRGQGINADSDWDAYDHWELDYDIVDRKGRPAKWITDKMIDKDWEYVEEQIIEYFDSVKDD
jgi:hypothetical protein